MRASAVVLVLVACGHASPEDVAIATPPRVPERIVGGVPHGGPITQLAITEQADAALSVDSLHELRLWPSLDGKRQPIPLQISGVTQIVLGHAGEDLLAGVVDQSGSARILRISRDGVVRGKAQLPGDVAVEQIAAIDNGIIVVRDDQSIERYDASGVQRGRLVAGSGERIGDIAVRRGSAAVLISAQVEPEVEPPPASKPRVPAPEPPPPPPNFVPPLAPTASEMRWIVIDAGLRWGTAVKLPKPVDARILALAPNHRRIAVLDAATQTVSVLELDPLAKQLAAASMLNATPTVPMGFVDDDHLAVVMGTLRWWTAPAMKPAADPWAVETPPPSPSGGRSDVGAIGDGLVVSGFAAALELTSLTVTRYLGWKYIGQGVTSTLDNRVGLAISNSHVLWLDDNNLTKAGEADVTDGPEGTPAYSVFVGPHHVVTETIKDSKYVLQLVNSERRQPTKIGIYPYVERIEYDPELRVLVLGTQGQVYRYAIDTAHDAVTELPGFKVSLQVQGVRLLDPAKSNGVIALVTTYEDDGQHLAVYRDEKPDKAHLIHASKTMAVKGAVLGTDTTGAAYVRIDADPPQLALMRDGRIDTKYPPELLGDQVIASHDATRFVTVRNSELALYDAHGKQLWHQTEWATMTVQFTTDDKKLVLRTSGGLVLLDAATGVRVAQACGFEFGVFDKDPPVNTLGVTPVCEALQ